MVIISLFIAFSKYGDSDADLRKYGKDRHQSRRKVGNVGQMPIDDMVFRFWVKIGANPAK